jgi:hypothetical protein
LYIGFDSHGLNTTIIHKIEDDVPELEKNVHSFSLVHIHREKITILAPDENQKGVYLCVCIRIYVCMCVCMYVCRYEFMYICKNEYVHIYVCIHIYMYIYTCICIYIYIYIHTYENTKEGTPKSSGNVPGAGLELLGGRRKRVLRYIDIYL